MQTLWYTILSRTCANLQKESENSGFENTRVENSRKPLEDRKSSRFGKVISLDLPEEKLGEDLDECLDLSDLMHTFKVVHDSTLGFTGLYAVNGTQTSCLIDSGASLSFISEKLVKERNLPTRPLVTPLKLQLATEGAEASVELITYQLSIKGSNGRDKLISLHVVDMKDDVVIGQDLFAALGIYLGGVSMKAADDEKIKYESKGEGWGKV
jgi:hypothetical protein